MLKVAVICPRCNQKRLLDARDANRLKRGGMCYKCTRLEQKREDNPAWKGGRYIDCLGYVRVLVSGHPRADKSGYVKEHILILEKKLGRPLATGEQVHHINGIKSDNRPDNLELYSKSQHMSIHRSKTPRDYHGRFMSVVSW